MPQSSRNVIIVTGLSGAGKSVTLKTLEDLGYEAIDNVPLSILWPMLSQDTQERLSEDTMKRPLAIGVDIRTRDFDVDGIQSVLQFMTQHEGLKFRMLFLDCDDEVLQRRYTETRRRHPLAVDRPLQDGIDLERLLLGPLRDHADDVIDTSNQPLTSLKTMLTSKYASVGTGLHVFVTSFSFRRGLPREADLVFDVRFLRNPHYDAALRDCTGRDPDVQDYIKEDEGFEDFMQRLIALLDPLLPRYETEGKSYLTLAVGCTGGRHRSVFVVEYLGKWLKAKGRSVSVRHRELPGQEA